MIYSPEEAGSLVIRAGKALQKSGLIVRTYGNISARISETQFVITPSGRAYEDLTPADIVVVNVADGTYEGNNKPSSELGVHRESYRIHPEAGFVIHTHQAYASAISVLGVDFKTYRNSPEEKSRYAMLGSTVPCAAYGPSSTKELSDHVAKQMEKHPDAKSVLMRNHGALCIGEDYEEAFDVTHALEAFAEEIFTVHVTNDHKKAWIIKEIVSSPGSSCCPDPEKQQLLSKYAVFTDMPYLLHWSNYGKREMKAYLDDFAMAVGVTVPTLPAEPSEEELKAAFEGREAVFLKGRGAICVGEDEEEAEAVAMILEKGSMAALCAMEAGGKPLSHRHAVHDREVYVNSYAALKKKS